MKTSAPLILAFLISSTFSIKPTSVKSPSKIIDLSNWGLILPISGKNGKALQVRQPELDTLSNKNFYADSSAVYFAPHFGGVKTPSSLYPRSELRQMKGSSPASWSTNTKHFLKFHGAILKQPGNPRARITIAQLFSTSRGFVAAVRLTSKSTFELQVNRKRSVTMINYDLGDEYFVEMSTDDGVLTVSITINDDTDTRYVPGLKCGDCYWKAGAYIQSKMNSVKLKENDQVLVKMTDIEAF